MTLAPFDTPSYSGCECHNSQNELLTGHLACSLKLTRGKAQIQEQEDTRDNLRGELGDVDHDRSSGYGGLKSGACGGSSKGKFQGELDGGLDQAHPAGGAGDRQTEGHGRQHQEGGLPGKGGPKVEGQQGEPKRER